MAAERGTKGQRPLQSRHRHGKRLLNLPGNLSDASRGRFMNSQTFCDSLRLFPFVMVHNSFLCGSRAQDAGFRS
jgi:hypothetical protein